MTPSARAKAAARADGLARSLRDELDRIGQPRSRGAGSRTRRDDMIAAVDEPPHDRATDEPGAAGHDDPRRDAGRYVHAGTSRKTAAASDSPLRTMMRSGVSAGSAPVVRYITLSPRL